MSDDELVAELLRFLDDVVERIREHQDKRMSLLRRLSIARRHVEASSSRQRRARFAVATA